MTRRPASGVATLLVASLCLGAKCHTGLGSSAAAGTAPDSGHSALHLGGGGGGRRASSLFDNLFGHSGKPEHLDPDATDHPAPVPRPESGQSQGGWWTGTPPAEPSTGDFGAGDRRSRPSHAPRQARHPKN